MNGKESCFLAEGIEGQLVAFKVALTLPSLFFKAVRSECLKTVKQGDCGQKMRNSRLCVLEKFEYIISIVGEEGIALISAIKVVECLIQFRDVQGSFL